MSPCTTKRRTTTDLKTKNNQNCQKIILHGSLTTKELKKKHSFRLAVGVEMSSQGGEDSQQGGGWRTGVGEVVASKPAAPHLHVDKPGRTTGEQE